MNVFSKLSNLSKLGNLSKPASFRNLGIFRKPERVAYRSFARTCPCGGVGRDDAVAGAGNPGAASLVLANHAVGAGATEAMPSSRDKDADSDRKFGMVATMVIGAATIGGQLGPWGAVCGALGGLAFAIHRLHVEAHRRD